MSRQKLRHILGIKVTLDNFFERRNRVNNSASKRSCPLNKAECSKLESPSSGFCDECGVYIPAKLETSHMETVRAIHVDFKPWELTPESFTEHKNIFMFDKTHFILGVQLGRGFEMLAGEGYSYCFPLELLFYEVNSLRDKYLSHVSDAWKYKISLFKE